MPRSKTPSFITEIPLVVNSSQAKELRSRFQAARQLYNAVLNEAMVRVALVKQSDLYRQAKKMNKGKARNDAFNAARQAYRYSDFDLQAYANLSAKQAIWIAEKLDAQCQQKIATRAFLASEKVLLGVAKSVRFKVPNRFNSVEGKTNKQGIRWTGESLVWGKLRLPGVIDPDNPVMQHGRSSNIKYVRIVKRQINQRVFYFAQLICEGLPYQKPQNYVAPGSVGIDLNISNVAYVADQNAGLLPFAEGVPDFQKEIGTLQRQMDRSRRQSNPENYEADFLARKGRKVVKKKGKSKKGSRKWNKSKQYQKLAAKKRELERRKAAYVKSQNRKLVNDILRHGNQIKAENVSVKAWQKRYGKAIKAKSPGFFQAELSRKAVSAGGSFTKFSTQKTALSQTHLTGERIKKTLGERIHYDRSGFVMHRDLFSAFLSRYVIEDQLSLQDAQLEYPRLEPILLEAWQQYQQSANQVGTAERRSSQLPSEQISNNPVAANQIDAFRADRKVS